MRTSNHERIEQLLQEHHSDGSIFDAKYVAEKHGVNQADVQAYIDHILETQNDCPESARLGRARHGGYRFVQVVECDR